MAKPPGAGTAHQPRRPPGAAGGRGGQWSNKPVADSPPSGGIALGESAPGASDAADGTPARQTSGPASIKLTGPRVRGRHLQVTIRRDPDTGMWVNPTMFGDEMFRTLSDAPWKEGGAEEAKGLHAQVFVDMLNAGDALPCPEHAKAALKGTQEAGKRWAGWGESRAKHPASVQAVQIAAAVRAEIYFRNRLQLWGQTGAGEVHRYPPIVYLCGVMPLFLDIQWRGEDGRLMERLAMLEDSEGNTFLDKPEHIVVDAVMHLKQIYSRLPVCLLGMTDLDETVKAKCFDMLELAGLQGMDWKIMLMEIHQTARKESVHMVQDSVRNILRHTSDDANSKTRYELLEGLSLLKLNTRYYPVSELFECEFVRSQMHEHMMRQLTTRPV